MNFFKLSRLLSWISLIAWLVSFGLTSIVGDLKWQFYSGLNILAVGWFAPWVGIFAWYANIPYAIKMTWLLKPNGEKGNTRFYFWISCLATLLAVNTFQASKFPLINDSTIVYGFGVGSIIWVSSIIFSFIAVTFTLYGFSKEEKNSQKTPAGLLIGLSISILLVFWALTTFYAVTDRRNAVGGERERLRSVVFKKGEVCGVAGIDLKGEVLLEGPLELELAGVNRSVTTVLEWGIPIVRYKGFDFVQKQADGDRYLIAEKASGPASAFYSLQYQQSDRDSPHQYSGHAGEVTARLSSQLDNKTHFEYTTKHIGHRRCPEQAFNGPLMKALTLVESNLSVSDVKNPTVMKLGDSDHFCPRILEIGLSDQNLYNFIKIGEKYYGPVINSKICGSGNLYIYSLSESYFTFNNKKMSKISLHLIARSATDFSKKWETRIRRKLNFRLIGTVSVTSIREENGAVMIILQDEGKQKATIQFPLGGIHSKVHDEQIR